MQRITPVINAEHTICRALSENDKFLMDASGRVIGIEYEDGERLMYGDMFSFLVEEVEGALL